MSTELLVFMEYLIFFGALIIVFKALNAFDLSRIFKKGHTFQIQTLFIMFSVVMAYLFTSAIMRLITLIQEL